MVSSVVFGACQSKTRHSPSWGNRRENLPNAEPMEPFEGGLDVLTSFLIQMSVDQLE